MTLQCEEMRIRKSNSPQAYLSIVASRDQGLQVFGQVDTGYAVGWGVLAPQHHRYYQAGAGHFE